MTNKKLSYHRGSVRHPHKPYNSENWTPCVTFLSLTV